MLAGIIRSFAERCPEAELTVLSVDPTSTAKVHGVKAVPRTSMGDVLSTIRGCDLLVSGGGSLLQDVTSSRSLLYYLGIIWLAKRLGKKVMIYAQGIGPINGHSSRQMARRVLNRTDLITVRDDASKAYLADLGVDRPEIRVTADPSFVMQPEPTEIADEVLKLAGIPLDRPLIGISLRPWKDQSVWLPSFATGLEQAAARIGASLVFIPMQKEQDMSVCIQVASGLGTPASVISAQLEPAETLSLISRMSFVVGMRLHALIFAASAGVPFVGVSYDPKVESFVRLATHEGPMKVESLSSADVAARIQDAWDRRDEIASFVRERSDRLRSVALSNADMACELIGD